MFKKAVSKWTIAFLAGFILTVAVIIMVVVVFPLFSSFSCSMAQGTEIQNVELKVDEMRGKSGYESMYFEVKDCVEEIKYDDDAKKIKVKYTTTEVPVEYSTKVRWDNTETLNTPGSYLFRVYEDHVENMGKV